MCVYVYNIYVYVYMYMYMYILFFISSYTYREGLPGGSVVKGRRCVFDPWVKKIPCRRKWQPTPVFLPRKSHGQRSLVVSQKSQTQLSD